MQQCPGGNNIPGATMSWGQHCSWLNLNSAIMSNRNVPTLNDVTSCFQNGFDFWPCRPRLFSVFLISSQAIPLSYETFIIKVRVMCKLIIFVMLKKTNSVISNDRFLSCMTIYTAIVKLGKHGGGGRKRFARS